MKDNETIIHIHEDDYEECYGEVLVCEKCGTNFMVSDYPKDAKEMANYCPCCGRKRVGFAIHSGKRTVYEFEEAE